MTCVREGHVEASIDARLAAVTFTNEEVTRLGCLVANLKHDWRRERQNRVRALELNGKRLQDRIDRLTDAYIDGLIDRDVFERRKYTLLLEQKAAQEELARLKVEERSVPAELAQFLELTKSVHSSYKVGLPQEKREILQIVTSNLSACGKNVEIRLRSPFREGAERPKLSNGEPYRDTHRTGLEELFHTLVHHFASGANMEAEETEPSA